MKTAWTSVVSKMAAMMLLLAATTATSGCAFVIVGGSIHGDDSMGRTLSLKGDEREDDEDWEAEGARTFFVVPAKLPNGAPADTQRAALEAWLIDRAGGYTELGPVRGGWKADDGRVVVEDNVAYLVTIDEDADEFAEELEARIVEDFDQEEAYVEQW